MITEKEREQNSKYKMSADLKKELRRNSRSKKWIEDEKKSGQKNKPKGYVLKPKDIKSEKANDIREKYLKSKYGLSKLEYTTMLRRQRNKCGICKTHQRDLPIKMCVDHCHKTGKIRGLLCSKCNLGIGYFGDDRVILHKASSYLKRHQSKK